MKLYLIVFGMLAGWGLPAAAQEPARTAPPGFVVQKLRFTGGNLFRPREWYSYESVKGRRITWTISRDNLALHPYSTGVRIQFFSGIQEGTGKTTQQFCQDFLETRRMSGKVMREYPVIQAGLFTRQGVDVIETVDQEEGKPIVNRVVYSAFWTKDGDIACIMGAGSREAEWKNYADVFDVISGDVHLMDLEYMQRGGADALPAEPMLDGAGAKKLIAQLRADPAHENALDWADAIKNYSDASPDLTVKLDTRYLPWIAQERSIPKERVLISAYIAGNIEKQMELGKKEDRAVEGIVCLLDVYGKLREKNSVQEIPQYDQWRSLGPENLRRTIEELVRTAREL